MKKQYECQTRQHLLLPAVHLAALSMLVLACQKQELGKAYRQEDTLQWTILPQLRGRPFLFDQDYLLQGVELRLQACTFTLSLGGNNFRTLTLDEWTPPSGLSFLLGGWTEEMSPLTLFFDATYTKCRDEDSGGQGGIVEVCQSEDRGYFLLRGKLDLNGDGILERSFDFSVPTRPLMLEKQLAGPAVPEITLNLDIAALFAGVRFSEIERISTQIRVAENLPQALQIP